MKISLELTEEEVKEAVAEWLDRHPTYKDEVPEDAEILLADGHYHYPTTVSYEKIVRD